MRVEEPRCGGVAFRVGPRRARSPADRRPRRAHRPRRASWRRWPIYPSRSRNRARARRPYRRRSSQRRHSRGRRMAAGAEGEAGIEPDVDRVADRAARATMARSRGARTPRIGSNCACVRRTQSASATGSTAQSGVAASPASAAAAARSGAISVPAGTSARIRSRRQPFVAAPGSSNTGRSAGVPASASSRSTAVAPRASSASEAPRRRRHPPRRQCERGKPVGRHAAKGRRSRAPALSFGGALGGLRELLLEVVDATSRRG